MNHMLIQGVRQNSLFLYLYSSVKDFVSKDSIAYKNKVNKVRKGRGSSLY
jgi:hypothetical protein